MQVACGENGKCPLRKWNHLGTPVSPTRLFLKEEDANRTLRKLDKIPPNHRRLVEARKAICTKCPERKRHTDLTVYCRACNCKCNQVIAGSIGDNQE